MAAMIRITATTTNNSMRENPASGRLVRLDPLVDLSRLITLLSRANLLRSTQFHSGPTIRTSIRKTNGGERRLPFSPK